MPAIKKFLPVAASTFAGIAFSMLCGDRCGQDFRFERRLPGDMILSLSMGGHAGLGEKAH